MAVFDLEILMDQEQQIQLLTFVFVQTFGLDGEHSVGVDPDPLLFIQPLSQRLFVQEFDVGQILQEIAVVGESQELLQFIGILLEGRTDSRFNFAAELGVALQQPATEGDAIGLVVEFLGIELRKVCQLGVFENFRM